MPKWYSATHPITCRFPGTLAALARSSTANLRWHRGRCRRPNSQRSLRTVFSHLAAYSVDGSIHFQCMDWRHLQEMLAAGAAAYTDLKNLCVWAKNNGGMGSLYRSQHELVFVLSWAPRPTSTM